MNLIAAACVLASAISLILAVIVLWLNPRAALNQVVALAAFAYFLWAFFAGTSGETLGRIDSNPQWIPLKIALTADIATVVLGLAANVVFAKLRRGLAGLLIAPFLVASLAQIYQVWAGVWVISGVHQGPWGSVIDLNADSIWPTFNGAVMALSSLLNLGVLIRARKRSRSKKYRSIAGQLLVVGILINIVATTLVGLWISLGWPDLSVFMGLAAIGNYFLLIVRYRHLADERPRLTGELFASLPEAVLLADHHGGVIDVSASLAALLQKNEASLRKQRVFDVFDGWPQLGSHWRAVATDHLPQTNLVGTIAGELFLLALTPGKDRFNDLQSVSFQVKPVTALESAVERYQLSQRELEVARLIAEGLENQAVAEGLSISPATVKFHLKNLFSKTGTSTRVELVKVLTV